MLGHQPDPLSLHYMYCYIILCNYYNYYVEDYPPLVSG